MERRERERRLFVERKRAEMTFLEGLADAVTEDHA
jgi:hypothetical protein